jgi:gluconolactonase
VWVWSPLGLPLYRIVSCDNGLLTTNIAYGGKDNRTLFITNSLSDNILIAELPEPGEPMFGLMD